MLASCLLRCHELELAVLDDHVREISQEVKDTALGFLVLAECLVIHEEVHDLVILCGSLDPAEELVPRKRPVLPVLVRESECYIITECIIPEEELELRSQGACIYIVRALPSEDMLCAFGQHGLEAHVINHRTYLVGIDKLCIPERLRSDAEIVLDGFLVFLHLTFELSRGSDGCQRVVICLGKEFHAARSCQLAETVDYLRCISVELFEY